MNKRAVIILLAVTLTTKVHAEDTVDLVGPLTSGKSGKSSGKSSKSNNMSLLVEEDVEVEGKSFKYGKSIKASNGR